MEEYTNPTAETIDDGSDLFTDDTETTEEGLFDDYGEGTDEVSEEETEEASETNEPEPDPAPQTIVIKYNGEKKEITLEEAVTLAQKGMNYDKVVGERDALKHSKANHLIGEFARMNNMTTDQYIDFLQNHQKKMVIEAEAKTIREKHPDAPEDVIREMAEMRAAAKEKDAAADADREKAREEEERRKPWAELLREYPRIKRAEDLPEEVLAAINDGANPVEAMRRHELSAKDKEIAELKAKLEAKEKNQTNKKRAIGSTASDAHKGEKDAFLMGFDGF